MTGTGWRHLTVEEGHHEHRAKYVELAHTECHLQDNLKDQLGYVCAKEDTCYLHLPSVICILGFLLHSSISAVPQLLHHPLLFVDDVDSMAQVDKGGCGHKSDLQDPVMNVGNWEHPVIAGVMTSRFQGVTVELGHFVSPDFVRSSAQDEDPEQEKDAHPDLPNYSGVRLDFVQQCGHVRPVTHG